MYNLVPDTRLIRGTLCWNPFKMVKTAVWHLREQEIEDLSGFMLEQPIFPRKTQSNTPELACIGNTGCDLSLAWPSPVATAEEQHGNTLQLSKLCPVLHQALQPDVLVSPQNQESSSVSECTMVSAIFSPSPGSAGWFSSKCS